MVNSPQNSIWPGRQLSCLVRSKGAKGGNPARSLIEKSSLLGEESRSRAAALPKVEEGLGIRREQKESCARLGDTLVTTVLPAAQEWTWVCLELLQTIGTVSFLNVPINFLLNNMTAFQ